MNYPEINAAAPNFSLQNQDGDTRTLADYSGKWLVLYFYPKAMTPGCTTQACELRDHKTELEALNAVAVGISPDAVSRLTKFTERDALNFDLLSDENHTVAESYGVWGLKKFMGREYDGIHRTTFLISPEGKLHTVLNKFKTKTHHDDVIALLQSVQS
jgi:peroxiredoxin Q/BCP